MRILVLSDTHIPGPKVSLPDALIKELEISDLCFHAGDLISYALYQQLSKKIKTYAVAGNMDDELVSENLPKKQLIEINRLKFGLIHGGGTPATLIQYIDYQFRTDYNSIDIFIFGHSHQPTDLEKNGKIYFNPGSAGETLTSSIRTYGVLTVENNKITRSIKKIG